MLDKVHFKDGVTVSLAPYAAPRYPCPKCGKESKDRGLKGDVPEKLRICATCRFEFEYTPDNILQMP